MKILKEIKNGFEKLDRRAYILLIISLLLSIIAFLASVALYLIGGVREQNMLTYFASVVGNVAVSIGCLGTVASLFVDIIEKSANDKK